MSNTTEVVNFRHTSHVPADSLSFLLHTGLRTFQCYTLNPFRKDGVKRSDDKKGVDDY